MFEPASKSMPPRTIFLAVLAIACVAGGFVCILLGASFQLGMAVLLAGAGLVLLVAVLEYRRAPQLYRHPLHSAGARLFADLKEQPLPEEGVAWLSIDPYFVKRFRRFTWMIHGLPLVILIAMLWLWGMHDDAISGAPAPLHRAIVFVMGGTVVAVR